MDRKTWAGIDIVAAKITDLPRLLDFFFQISPSFQIDPQFTHKFFAWKYFDLEGRETGFPPAFMALRRQKVVGFIGCMPFFLRSENAVLPAGWVADWKLLPEAKGYGIGRKLLGTAVGNLPAVACINGSQDAKKIFEQYGFLTWTTARAWTRIKRTIPFFFRNARYLTKLTAYKRMLRYVITPRYRDIVSADSIGVVPCVISELPVEFVENASGLARTIEYYGWISRFPGAATHTYLVSDHGEAVGFAVVSVGKDKYERSFARIVDLQIKPDRKEQLTSALMAVVAAVEAADPTLVYTEFTLSVSQEGYARRLGFYGGGPRSWWLKTDGFVTGPGIGWKTSYLEKDDASRHFYIIP